MVPVGSSSPQMHFPFLHSTVCIPDKHSLIHKIFKEGPKPLTNMHEAAGNIQTRILHGTNGITGIQSGSLAHHLCTGSDDLHILEQGSPSHFIPGPVCVSACMSVHVAKCRRREQQLLGKSDSGSPWCTTNSILQKREAWFQEPHGRDLAG